MIKIEKIIPGGFGLATNNDGKKVFLWNVLPGEIVDEFIITKNKSRYLEGIATKISSSSPYRLAPKDECYLSTSPWQIMSYDYEIKIKQELVVELFREHDISIKLPEITTDYKEYFYRNKMEYALYWDNDESTIRLAFHTRGSHRKSPIVNSSLERPEILSKANEIINNLNKKHEEARKYQSLLLRCNQKGEVSGGLYENHQPHPSFSNLSDSILGQTYSYSPNGFFQINLPVYEMALVEIKKHIISDEVLDLYAGVGTIGLSVARDHRLTLVESDKSAFRELLCNTTNNSNANAILEKSENILSQINHHQTVIVDPPRAGCDKKLIEQLINICPERIIYLSCNPATQARDTKMLLQKYTISEIKTFNFFPHTPHIENLVVLSRK